MLSTVPGTEFSPSLQKRQARYWEQEVTDVASQQLAEHKSAYQQVIAVARIQLFGMLKIVFQQKCSEK